MREAEIAVVHTFIRLWLVQSEMEMGGKPPGTLPTISTEYSFSSEGTAKSSRMPTMQTISGPVALSFKMYNAHTHVLNAPAAAAQTLAHSVT